MTGIITAHEVRVGDKIRVTTSTADMEMTRTFLVERVDDGYAFNPAGGRVRIAPHASINSPIVVELLERPEAKPEPGLYRVRNSETYYRVAEDGAISLVSFDIGKIVVPSCLAGADFLYDVKRGYFIKLTEEVQK